MPVFVHYVLSLLHAALNHGQCYVMLHSANSLKPEEEAVHFVCMLRLS